MWQLRNYGYRANVFLCIRYEVAGRNPLAEAKVEGGARRLVRAADGIWAYRQVKLETATIMPHFLVPVTYFLVCPQPLCHYITVRRL